jgi:hypothetical protein
MPTTGGRAAGLGHSPVRGLSRNFVQRLCFHTDRRRHATEGESEAGWEGVPRVCGQGRHWTSATFERRATRVSERRHWPVRFSTDGACTGNGSLAVVWCAERL